MIRIFLAEDQSMLNTALTTILDLEDDLEVVGNAKDGQSALEQIRDLKPDIAILDIEMPYLTGLEIAKKLQEEHTAIKIIILTTFAQDNYFEQAVSAHVGGYLLKDSPSSYLIQTIHDVMHGETIYDSELVSELMLKKKSPFTSREVDILQAIQLGLSTKEIAGKLYLSEGTVRNYISTILDKTNAKNRIDALRIAKQNKWL